MENNSEEGKHKNWFLRHKIITGIIIVVFILSVIILLGGSEESSSTNEPATEQSDDSKKEVQVEVVQAQPQKNDLSGIDYSIISTEDISFKSAQRFTIRVLLNNNPATQDQIRAVSEKIVEDYKDKADAVAIFFYFEESQADGAYTLAKAEWAPYGDWSKADLKTNQKLVYDFKDSIGKKRTNEPSAEDREINKAMRDLWYEMAEKTNDLVTDEDIATILAPKYGKTVEEMLEIRRRVNSYDLGS